MNGNPTDWKSDKPQHYTPRITAIWWNGSKSVHDYTNGRPEVSVNDIPRESGVE